MRIRDPIHGTLPVSAHEAAVVDSVWYQRLRHVRQLGFGELAFPGATHTRHAHSLGAMHVVAALPLPGRPERPARVGPPEIQDGGASGGPLPRPRPHASQSRQRRMPPRAALGLQAWTGPDGGQARHEDFTVKLLLDTDLADLVAARVGDQGITGEALAALVTGRTPPGGLDFRYGGADWALRCGPSSRASWTPTGWTTCCGTPSIPG